MWEPLPLSSLDPAPAKNPSSPERRATFPEQELQQLEIGKGAAASGSLGPWVPGSRQGLGLLLVPASVGSLLAPSPEISTYSLCRKSPDNTAGPSQFFTVSSAFFCRIISEQPVPAILSGGTRANSLMPQHRQPLPVR